MRLFRSFTFDAKAKEFKSNSSAESQFYKQLRKVARASSHIVEAHIDGATIKDAKELERQLKNYARVITPWAKKQSAKLLESVAKKNRKAYQAKSKFLGAELKLHLAEQNVTDTVKVMMNEQVELITSIPLEAGQRAQALATEAFFNGTRSDEIAKELLRTTDVTESRAKLIAVTETARANASITQARATAIGVRAYTWRTTMDGAERDSHAEMNGEPVLYSQEPTLSDGTKGHAGTFPRCRCWQDPIFD